MSKRQYLILIVVAAVLVLLLFNKYKTSLNNQKQNNPITLADLISPTRVNFDHIFIVVMENKAYIQVIDNKSAPYFNNLAKNYAPVHKYYGVAHPSLPNYIALIGGDTFGINSDCTNCFLSQKNLVDSLEQANIPWKAYMESMPKTCYIGDAAPYAQKHDPFIYFDNIRNNPDRCNKIVPYDQLNTDLTGPNLPKFIWITPNLCSDTHNCSVSVGDKWLSQNIQPILDSEAFTKQNSLMAVFFEEDNGFSENHVPMVLIAPKANLKLDPNITYNHYSLLHTIETSWNLPTLTEKDKAAPVFEFSVK